MEADERGADGSTAPGARSRGVASVLAGEVRYDDVDETTQLAVRDAWQFGIDRAIETLNLAARFRAQGRSWTEADADGNLIWRDT